jgi:TPR repeat protein
MQLRGMAGPKDATAAANSFSASCDAGEPGGCLNLGMLYDNGDGVPHDVARARQLFARACQAHVEGACKELRTGQ